MVSTPFRFFEVEEKVFGADTAQFGEAEFRKASEAFDAIDVIFATANWFW